MSTRSPIGRVSFESVFTPSAMKEGDGRSYSLTLLFPKDFDACDKIPDQYKDFCKKQMAAMKKAVNDAMLEHHKCDMFGKHPETGKKVKKVYNPFRCGSEKEHLDGYDDTIVFAAFKTNEFTKKGVALPPPKVVGPDKRPITKESGLWYSGCWGLVTWHVYPFFGDENQGVGLGLGNIQKFCDDSSFGGVSASDPEDDFDAFETVADIDELDDDESPF